MKLANNYFLTGAMLAILLIALFGGNGLLNMVLASGEHGRMPRELRLGCEIGLISPQQLSKASLNRKITSADFAENLAQVMMLLGALESADARELTRAGIVTGRAGSGNISRSTALETLARASIMLAGKDVISLTDGEAVNYRDYRIADKYSRSIAWLQSKYIVRGYPDGTLGKNRSLSKREATFFLYRFYEAVSSEMMGKRPADKLSFIDVPLSHPIMETIENLTQRGAFDKLILRPSFDGDSFVTVSDLTEMLNGIFGRAGKEIDQIQIKTIFTDNQGDSFSRRRHLALALEYVLDSFARERLVAQKINYRDISIEQPEFEALIKLAGCGLTLGYNDGRFAGNESVTWYEAAKLLNEVLKFASIAAPVEEKKDRLAVKSDIEAFKALIRAKKEKIHQILSANKR
ncbi:MAG: S-layer homology domain-containing protein [Candidatus Riflebacteria bacterium]|nr:S-layer homology domain-containing protein [Candidatus Riflebacteria bacterium]